jgi:uncharacterized protein (TIGR02217 family)
MAFHEIRFPTAISRGASGGPERRTEVVVLGSGHEERNSRWADSRRSYDAGYGVRSLDDLHAVIAFFEERRGRLHAFRWRDHADWKSCAPGGVVSPLDQPIAIADGIASAFPLVKVYGSAHAPYTRLIRKPVADTVAVAVDGIAQTAGTHFTVNSGTGGVQFLPGFVPTSDAEITAGYEFDVPVRFDTDKLEISLSGFRHGAIPRIPIVEVRL